MRDKKQAADQKANKTILSRTLFLLIMCGIVVFIPVIRQLYILQIRDHDMYEEMAIRNQTKTVNVSAARGTIYDSNMNILAISASVENVYLDPNEIYENDQDIDLIASGLSEILGVDKEKITALAQDRKLRYKIVSRKINKELADQVREFISEYKLAGVHLEPDTKRYYPAGSLAAQVLGFVGTDNTGLEGIEAKYESTLQGTQGRIITAKSNDGTEMLYKFEKYYDAADGKSLVLTIDSTVQYFLEKNIEAAMEQYDVANGAFGIIMDVNTGAILAMTTLNAYDPNNYSQIYDDAVRMEIESLPESERSGALAQAQLEQWRNRIVNDGYEPGSTFKAITLAIAIEEGAVNENNHYYCGGSTSIKGRTTPLHCWKEAGHGSLDIAGALQNSCNIAFANIGIELGADKLYEYVKALGLTEPTGVDLPGEQSGYFFNYETIADSKSYASLTSASFGQTFKVTPIQLVRAISAVVNGGYLVEPYIVSEILDQDGNVAEKTETTVIRQVFSESTSAKMCELLESVVVVGTGKNAYVPGYRVGGKTGTSEKIDEKTEDKIVSFVGVAPADNPQYICLVALDTPSHESGVYLSGGQMAAPTVRNVLSDVLPYLGVEAVYTEEELSRVDTAVPSLTGLTLDEAAGILSEKGFSYRVEGDGGKVTDQIPTGGSIVPLSAEVVLYMGKDKPTELATVPSVINLTESQAEGTISYNGLYMKSVGAINISSDYILATKQSVEPGEQVPLGTVIEVDFTDTTIYD